MSKRKAVDTPPQERSTRSTRSSAAEATPLSLPVSTFTSSKHPYRPVSINYQMHNHSFNLARTCRDPEVVNVPYQSYLITITNPKYPAKKRPNELMTKIRTKVRAKIGSAEALKGGGMLDQSEFERIVEEVADEEEVGEARGTLLVPKVPNLSQYREVGPGEWTVTALERHEIIHEDEFLLESISTAELEDLVAPAQRSSSYNQALASEDETLRALSKITAQACFATDAIMERTTATDWFHAFLLELNQLRRPIRQVHYGPRVTLRYLVDGPKVSLHCKLFEENGNTEYSAISTSDKDRVDDLNEHYETLLDLQENGSRTPAESILWQSLTSATKAVDEHRGASIEQRETILHQMAGKFVVKEIVGVEDKNGDVTIVGNDVVIDCLSGRSLITLPPDGSDQMIQEMLAQSQRTVSIDHFDQMVFGLVKGELIPIMNSRLNLGPISLPLQLFKFRWPGNQVALMFLAIAVGHKTTGVVAENQGLLEIHSRLLRVSKPAYRAPRMPCERYLRASLPLTRIKHVIDVDRAILAKFGVSFVASQHSSLDLIKDAGLTLSEFEEYADAEAQSMSDDYYRQFDKALDFDSTPPVRPGRHLKKSVSPTFKEQLLQASRGIENELLTKYNMCFVKTKGVAEASVIALSSDGNETVRDVCQLLLKFHHLEDELGILAENPHITLYVNSICFVAHTILSNRDFRPFSELTKVFFHDPINPGLPLMVPMDSKHPFGPSICSNNHPLHHHGWNVAVPRITDLRFETWQDSLNTMRLASAASNMADGQGPVQQMIENGESIQDSVNFFRSIPSTGFSNFMEKFCDSGPAGERFIVEIEKFIERLDNSRPVAPPPSAIANESEEEE
ncbi:hypothetical protein JCM3765_001731 [Sporobolomyces pararoseus]